MTSKISLGIDLGSTCYRSAGVIEGEIVSLPVGSLGSSQKSWITLNLTKGGDIQFPSIKYCLEKPDMVHTLSGTVVPADSITDIFREIKYIAESYSGIKIGHTVIAVPATYSESRRAALLQAVKKAELGNTHLVNEAIATTMDFGLQDPRESVFLIYNAGYTQFEIAIIRRSKTQIQALAYGRHDVPSGRIFDSSLLIGCTKALKERGLEMILQKFSPQEWFHLLEIVQNAKEKLGTYVDVHLSFINNANQKEIFYFPINKPNFDSYIGRLMIENLKLIDETIKDANLKPEDINRVLVTGGTSKMPVIQHILAKHLKGIPLQIMTDDTIARGAAAYAANLMGIKEEDSVTADKKIKTEDFRLINTDFLALNVVKTISKPEILNETDDHVKAKQIVQKPDTPSPEGQPNISDLWKYVHSMDITTAKEILNQIRNEADKQLQNISKDKPRKNWRINKACKLLDKGKYDEAVEESHRAWASNADNAQVLEDMVNIHIQAASKAESIEGYEDAIRWLGCAHNHDQSNVEILSIIADRHYQHAQQLNELGDYSGSLTIVRECLNANRGHLEALELKKMLAKKIQLMQDTSKNK